MELSGEKKLNNIKWMEQHKMNIHEMYIPFILQNLFILHCLSIQESKHILQENREHSGEKVVTALSMDA